MGLLDEHYATTAGAVGCSTLPSRPGIHAYRSGRACVFDHTPESGCSPMLRADRALRMAVVGQSKGTLMSAVQETSEALIIGETPLSAEVRETVLDREVAEQAAEGWALETNPDVEQVLVGHNKFRRVLVRRQWGIRTVRELVDVDKHGNISIRHT
jgi:hypothetical protein